MNANTPNNLRVIFAEVTTRELIMYHPDGLITSIPQGDPRVPRLVAEITPALAGGAAFVDVVLDPASSGSTYTDYEEKSGGLVKFFKVAKSALKSLFGGTNSEQAPAAPVPMVSPRIIKAPGPVPQRGAYTGGPVEPVVQAPAAQAARALSAVEEVMANAIPASTPGFHDKNTGVGGDHTMVAVVNNQVITGVEALKPQMLRAVQANGSNKGLNAFMTRISKVIEHRRHSVDELMRFLARGDLPIADDGSIIIYKALNRVPGKKGAYTDCHTGKVPQRVGSMVCMDPSLVDTNRRVECSNGLHVARRGYLRGFGGDVIVLAKVAPEDVISVPEYDSNKMRVCGYHILFELSDDAFRKLKNDQPMTDTEQAQLLLGRALSGNHGQPIEEVRIRGHLGTDVTVTPLTKVPQEATQESIVEPIVEPIEAPAPVEVPTIPLPTVTASVEAPAEAPVVFKAPKPKVKAEALPDHAEDDPKRTVAPVDPKAVVKAVGVVKAEVETQSVKALRLWAEFNKAKSKKARADAAQTLLDFKKQAKKGWTTLGLSEEAAEELKTAAG